MRGGLGHFALGLLALSVAGLFGCGKEGGRSTANVEPTCEVELVPGNSDEFVEDMTYPGYVLSIIDRASA